MTRAIKIVDMFEMSNAFPSDTGLPTVIWISSEGSDDKKGKHGPRIKVALDSGKNFKTSASVSISDSPELKKGVLPQKMLIKVSEYIILNKDALLDHWSGKTSSAQMFLVLKKV